MIISITEWRWKYSTNSSKDFLRGKVKSLMKLAKMLELIDLRTRSEYIRKRREVVYMLIDFSNVLQYLKLMIIFLN